MGVVVGVVEGVIDRIHRVSPRVIENNFKIGGKKKRKPANPCNTRKNGLS